MLQAPSSITFVAIAPQVLGMAMFEPCCDEHSCTISAESCAQISMVFVHPSAQRKGVGSALVRRVFAVARAQHFTVVRVWTGTDNPAAQRFYSSLAMVPTGRRTPGAFSTKSSTSSCCPMADRRSRTSSRREHLQIEGAERMHCYR